MKRLFVYANYTRFLFCCRVTASNFHLDANALGKRPYPFYKMSIISGKITDIF